MSKEYPSEKRVNVRKYRGVQIFRQYNMIAGSDLRELKNGELKPCKPQYETCYRFAGSAWYDSVDEVIEAIESIWKGAHNGSKAPNPKDFIEVMNTDS
jgi:hypothetical protein